MRPVRAEADGVVDDASLVRAVATGDRDALSTLYSRHAPWLLLRLTRRCNDRHLVDEAVQDTFVAVWRGARRWKGDGEVAAWIWGIAIRRLIDQLRGRPRPTTELRRHRHPRRTLRRGPGAGRASSTATWPAP